MHAFDRVRRHDLFDAAVAEVSARNTPESPECLTESGARREHFIPVYMSRALEKETFHVSSSSASQLLVNPAPGSPSARKLHASLRPHRAPPASSGNCRGFGTVLAVGWFTQPESLRQGLCPEQTHLLQSQASRRHHADSLSLLSWGSGKIADGGRSRGGNLHELPPGYQNGQPPIQQLAEIYRTDNPSNGCESISCRIMLPSIIDPT